MKKLFLLVTIVAGIFLISGPGDNSQKETSWLPTTYSKSRGGMKGLFLVLEELNKDTRRWKRPFPLLLNEKIGTLVVSSPRKPLSPREKEALDLWFAKGGQMILLHDGDWEIKASGYKQEAQSFNEVFNEQPQLTVIKEKLTNYELKQNPERSIAMIQHIISHSGPVYFDEYHLNNGEKTSPWDLLKQYCNHPVGWVTLHLIALFFLYMLSIPNPREINEDAKTKMNLVQARAAFLEFSQAKDFANQVILKYRSNKNESY